MRRCPHCNAPVGYDGGFGVVACAYCGAAMDLGPAPDGGARPFEAPASAFLPSAHSKPLGAPGPTGQVGFQAPPFPPGAYNAGGGGSPWHPPAGPGAGWHPPHAPAVVFQTGHRSNHSWIWITVVMALVFGVLPVTCSVCSVLAGSF